MSAAPVRASVFKLRTSPTRTTLSPLLAISITPPNRHILPLVVHKKRL